MRIVELESRCVLRTVGSNSAAGFRGQASDWIEVRFGSRIRDVRFTPKSGHVERGKRCRLSAISVHSGWGAGHRVRGAVRAKAGDLAGERASSCNHAGQALNAVLTMARNSLAAAPPAACTAIPYMTVATKRANAAASTFGGKSPSFLARSRRLRISASPPARREDRSRLTASHSSPPDSAPCTMRQPLGLHLSLKRSAVPSSNRAEPPSSACSP